MPNPPKTLNAKELEEVEAMAGLGLRYEDIARIKGMSDDTLKKYAQTQLQRGKSKAKAKVMQTAFQMATSGKTPAMTMFWLKTQAGWRENQAPTHNDPAETLRNLINVLRVPTKSELENRPSQAIALHLAETMEALKQGDVDPRVASSVASMANTLMKAVTQSNLEARLASLESILKAHEPDPLELDL